MKLFLVKSKTYGLGTTLLSCRIVRISGLLDVGLKESLRFVRNWSQETWRGDHFRHL